MVVTAEVDPAELAVRMCEAFFGMARPMPDPVAALAAMGEECSENWLRVAKAAFDYFSERLNDLRVVN